MIDWTKPIELDTLPPRPAMVRWAYPDGSGADVYADWFANGCEDWQPTDNEGFVKRHWPRVRNVAAPAIAAPDIAAELAEALRPFAAAAHRIEYYDGEHYDAPLYAMRETDALRELLDDINGEPVRVQHLNRARAALAKWEASK